MTRSALTHFALTVGWLCSGIALGDQIDFNKQVRSILSNKCFACHGPDADKLQAGLRLDDETMATQLLDSGRAAIVPGKLDDSELIARIMSSDTEERMPPPSFAKPVTEGEITILKAWIEQGARYAKHWSYATPSRPKLSEPPGMYRDWPKNEIDYFTLATMLKHGLQPTAMADRETLARRLFLDLNGLPPTVAEVDAFVASADPQAYEKLVDDLLKRPAYGEHWARQWLDLARYADSAGYADDPVRTIWGYRDWVIRAYDRNMPFDQFTREQLAGDLLPTASDEQLLATAFHRNTMTNSEGGTNDEEFRNVAVVDRVNTTLAVWMGTTMACAQCHTHKYDPITQEEYFRVFAIFNNTEDADRRDEAPLLELFSEEQKQEKTYLTERIAITQQVIDTTTESLVASQNLWERELKASSLWNPLRITSAVRASGDEIRLKDDHVFVPTAADKDTYTVEIPVGEPTTAQVAAIRIETLPDAALPGEGSGHGNGNFVITHVKVQWIPAGNTAPKARYVRVEIPGKQKVLSLAEVQVFSAGENLATRGTATQSSTGFSGLAVLAIDGKTDGDFKKMSVTHTENSDDPWWELDLGSVQSIEKLVIWNRTDADLHVRLSDFRWKLLDEQRELVIEQSVKEAPNPSMEYAPSGVRDLPLQSAFADFEQAGFASENVLTSKAKADNGWAVGGATKDAHGLVLVLKDRLTIAGPATIRLIIEQNSAQKQHLLGKFRLQATEDDALIRRSRLPRVILTTLDQPADQRGPDAATDLARYYREHDAPELAKERRELASNKKKLTDLKPVISVPVFRELTKDRRATQLQYRGNYLDQGPEVQPGVPAAFHSLPIDKPVDRLALAEWLIAESNPLTPRVLANRYWETLFGRGLVVTSEEFGSQGEPPTHPELLDWLATEVVARQWDVRELLKLIVTSATYRQSSKVNEQRVLADRDNRWLARGPRVRLSAEMVRDQALAVSGLLSSKRFGPPVKPMQPSLGLTAAFGSSTDWQTSDGEDRHRRALYTTWRRSNPYPSMATFDAPNREVCTIRRNQTNTPLQSLVTLNDPTFVEAAQALARSALGMSATTEVQLRGAFQRCLLRPPKDVELQSLLQLYQDAHAQLAEHPKEANRLATEPLGALPEGIVAVDAAAMTVVCNVLLNLDEMFLKR